MNLKIYLWLSAKPTIGREKKGEVGNTTIWISREQKSFFDEIKSIFHNYLRAKKWFGEKKEK